MKLWNWWLNTKMGDALWHYCFHIRHRIEVRFTTRYDPDRHGAWKWILR